MRKQKGLGFPLTIHVIPGQIFEGLIEQDDRQRHLKHHPPLPTAQWGHLENELVGAGRPGYRRPAVYLRHSPGLQWAHHGHGLGSHSSHLCLLGFPEEVLSPCPPSPSLISTQAQANPLSKRAPSFLFPEGGNICGMMATHICPYCHSCLRPTKAQHSVGASSV